MIGLATAEGVRVKNENPTPSFSGGYWRVSGAKLTPAPEIVGTGVVFWLIGQIQDYSEVNGMGTAVRKWLYIINQIMRQRVSAVYSPH